jgi:serine O-acetyltransferase
LTGIEIHPGARIGKGFFIDHGMGVVIGETAEIGEYVLMYHGVTLGGTSLKPGKRHPTVGNHVLIGAGAKIFGPLEIGDHSQIGGGAVVTKSVPSHAIVVGNPAQVIKRKGIKVIDPTRTVDQVSLPNPVAERLTQLEERVDRLSETHRQSGNNPSNIKTSKH